MAHDRNFAVAYISIYMFFGISNSVGSMTDPWRIPDFSLYFFFQRSILQPYTFCIYMVCVVFIRNSWHSSRILRSLIRQFKVFSHVVYVEVKNTNSVDPKTDPCSTPDLFSPNIELTTIHAFYLHVCPYTSIESFLACPVCRTQIVLV